MISNYHTHTARCHHATGADEEYIKRAIAEGIKILGFSDHAPYIYPEGYESFYKMTPGESGEYFSSLRHLRNKYKDKIEIHIGYEAEYYPALWDVTFDFWKKSNIPEYLILGQHFVREEFSKTGERIVHSARGTDERDMLSRYVDTVIEGLETGAFTYLAHPDVINFYGDEDFYKEEVERLVVRAKELSIPLEVNLLGMHLKRHYPTPLFWEVASKHSPDVILGTDAHEPERIADKDEILSALHFADKYKLKIIDTLPLVNPFKEK